MLDIFRGSLSVQQGMPLKGASVGITRLGTPVSGEQKELFTLPDINGTSGVVVLSHSDLLQGKAFWERIQRSGSLFWPMQLLFRYWDLPL
jgi:hypothetical protein